MCISAAAWYHDQFARITIQLMAELHPLMQYLLIRVIFTAVATEL